MKPRRCGWAALSCCLAAGSLSIACATGGRFAGGVRLAPLAAPRLVAAHRSLGNGVHIRMSDDGLIWTEGTPVTANGVAMTTVGDPTIAYDGALYHLYWLEPGGNVRYATARDAEQWIVQESALAQVPTASQPVFVRGNGRHFAFSRGTTAIQQIDLDNSAARTTLPARTIARPSAAFGNGRFVVAGVDPSNRAIVMTSRDGRQWSSPVRINLASVYEAVVSYSDGRYRVATKRRAPSPDSDFPGVACNVFDSADASSWTELRPAPGCGNVPSEPTAFRYGGRDLLLLSYDSRYVAVSTNGAHPVETHFVGPVGRISLVVGPGPQLAAFHLNAARVTAGVRQDLTIVSLGYHVRVGQPGSARVAYFRQLQEFASDVNAGQRASIPPVVSPPAWIVHPEVDVRGPNGRLDLMGGLQIAIDRGACPVGPITDKVLEARAALEDAMNRHLASASTAELVDGARSAAITQRIRCEVEKTLAGEDPGTCAPGHANPGQNVLEALASLFGSIASAVFDFIGERVTDVVCGFNRDEQLEPADVLIVGSQFFEEGDPPRTAYELDAAVPTRQLDPFTVKSTDQSKIWLIESSLRFLGFR